MPIPSGKRIQLSALKKFSMWQADSPHNDRWVEICGVVGNTPSRGLRDPALPGVYVPYTLLTDDVMKLLVRVSGAQSAIVHAARQQVAAVNGEQPLNPVSTLEERLRLAGWARQQFVASLFLLCAGLALLLAAVGLYSVVACSVSQREREFGLRIALGASGAHIVSTVFRSIGATILLGLACGVALTAILDRPIALWTESSLWSPRSLAPAIVLLALVGACAILIPARRAAASEPMDVLRADQ